MALISLVEWAERQGLNPSSARRKVLRGNLPAIKIGRNYVIEETTPNTDHRANGLSSRHKKKDSE